MDPLELLNNNTRAKDRIEVLSFTFFFMYKLNQTFYDHVTFPAFN